MTYLIYERAPEGIYHQKNILRMRGSKKGIPIHCVFGERHSMEIKESVLSGKIAGMAHKRLPYHYSHLSIIMMIVGGERKISKFLVNNDEPRAMYHSTLANFHD